MNDNDAVASTTAETNDQHHQPLVLSMVSHLKHSTVNTQHNMVEPENNPIQLILASQSPRRREILDMMGLKDRYKTQVSPLDETSLQNQLPTHDPIAYTQTLANAKAQALVESKSFASSTIVLASDTIVALEDSILEKPNSRDDALQMLAKLQGTSHVVHTAVCVMTIDDTIRISSSFVETAHVQFTTLSSADIHAYIDTGEPMDKAGSYGIQGIGGQLVESIRGDFFTVMGLPMHRTSQALAKAITELLQ